MTIELEQSWSAIDPAEEEERMLHARTWDEAIEQAERFGYPFAVCNTMLVAYDEAGEVADLDLLSRAWRAV